MGIQNLRPTVWGPNVRDHARCMSWGDVAVEEGESGYSVRCDLYPARFRRYISGEVCSARSEVTRGWGEENCDKALILKQKYQPEESVRVYQKEPGNWLSFKAWEEIRSPWAKTPPVQPRLQQHSALLLPPAQSFSLHPVPHSSSGSGRFLRGT
jgi:hypothetical protein